MSTRLAAIFLGLGLPRGSAQLSSTGVQGQLAVPDFARIQRPGVCSQACEFKFRGCLSDASGAFNTCRAELDAGAMLQSNCEPGCNNTEFMSCCQAGKCPAGHTCELAEAPTSPTPCNRQNQGRCDCANLKEADEFVGFMTYTWWMNGDQRCATVYVPPVAAKPMPVVLTFEKHALDQLPEQHFNGVNDREPINARRFGYAVVALSTPNKQCIFELGNDGVINDSDPQPCDLDQNPDLKYTATVFDILDADPHTFNTKQVFANGFSQSGMFAGYAAYCLAERIVGVAQTASGLLTRDSQLREPMLQTKCRTSDFNKLYAQCMTKTPCPECQYYPVYPCFHSRPMRHCILMYDDDNFSTSEPGNPYHKDTVGDMMYNAATMEGHDVRLFKFGKAGNPYRKFPHSNLFDQYDWVAGCLGIQAPCSSSCSAAVTSCAKRYKAAKPSKEILAYRSCYEDLLGKECEKGCAPTQEMLFESEQPSSFRLSYGTMSRTPAESLEAKRPSISKCEHTVSNGFKLAAERGRFRFLRRYFHR